MSSTLFATPSGKKPNPRISQDTPSTLPNRKKQRWGGTPSGKSATPCPPNSTGKIPDKPKSKVSSPIKPRKGLTQSLFTSFNKKSAKKPKAKGKKWSKKPQTDMENDPVSMACP
ncbi:hypothetical protein PtB15_5B720 [Puccinia triticina]|nr:hypothetical protein PtB15_5B720 [Puccinia triticina]